MSLECPARNRAEEIYPVTYKCSIGVRAGNDLFLRFQRSVMILLLLVLAASPVLGQEPDSTNQESENLPVYTVDPMVVIATRTATHPDDIASTVTTITADDLERKQARLVLDALRDTPGVDMRRNGGGGSTASIFLRGTDSDHTLVLVDGVEINDPSSPSRLPFMNHLTPDGVERIEILHGAQSTLYGSDAIGGVVNIITRKGQGKPRLTLWGEGGSYSTFREGLSFLGSSGAYSFAISASHSNSDRFSAQSSGTESDPYRNTSAVARFGYDPSDGMGIDMVVRHTDARVHFDGFLSESGFLTDAVQSLVKIEPHIDLYQGRWRQSLSLRTARHKRDTQGSSPSVIKGRMYSVDWQNTVSVLDHQKLVFGLEREWELAKFQNFKDDAYTQSAYFQEQIRVGKLFGTAGVRVDDHSTFGAEPTYRIAAGYRLSPATAVRMSYGTGFKTPSLSQLNVEAFAGNPDLSPEKSRGLDFGIKQRLLENRLSFGATYFYNDIDNLIISVYDIPTDEFLNLNIDQAMTQGVEFAVRARPISDLGLVLEYTYTETRAEGSPAGFGLTEGSNLLRRPEHKGRFDLDYKIPEKGIRVGMGASYVGTRLDLDPATSVTVEAGDYFLLNLNAAYDLTPRFQLLGRIDNLLDRDYEDVLGFSTAGFSLYGGVRAKL